MIYILEQRLSAQKVSESKSARVVQEVVSSVFSQTLVKNMFSEQPTFVVHQLRKMFLRLAHSSIMRLSEQSMDKLFDLMCMGLKHQALAIKEPYEILAVVLNHLEAISRILNLNDGKGRNLVKNVQPLVSTFREQIICTYSTLSSGKMLLVRQNVLNVLHGKIIKVSLLLQNKIQNHDGFMKVRTDGVLPIAFQLPGKVKHFSKGTVVSEDTMPLIYNKPAQPPMQISPMTDHSNFAHLQEHCTLGENMYDDHNHRRFRMPEQHQVSPEKELSEKGMSHLDEFASYLTTGASDDMCSFAVTLELDSDDEAQADKIDNSVIINATNARQQQMDDLFQDVSNSEPAAAEDDLLALMDLL